VESTGWEDCGPASIHGRICCRYPQQGMATVIRTRVSDDLASVGDRGRLNMSDTDM
jgi:hypothetical protein